MWESTQSYFQENITVNNDEILFDTIGNNRL